MYCLLCQFCARVCSIVLVYAHARFYRVHIHYYIQNLKLQHRTLLLSHPGPIRASPDYYVIVPEELYFNGTDLLGVLSQESAKIRIRAVARAKALSYVHTLLGTVFISPPSSSSPVHSTLPPLFPSTSTSAHTYTHAHIHAYHTHIHPHTHAHANLRT